MSYLTATLVLGACHPLNGEMLPRHQIEVYEGGQIELVVRPFDPSQETSYWYGVDPSLLLETVFALMALQLPDFAEHPLAKLHNVDSATVNPEQRSDLALFTRTKWEFAVEATLRDGSHIKQEDFTELDVAHVTVFTPTYLRHTFNPGWSQE